MLAGVACLASGGIFVKLSELGPIMTAFYRILIAMPLALLWARFSESPSPRAGAWNFPSGDAPLFALSGVFLALDLILWHISFHHTTVANANLLANLVPFVVVPLSWLLYREPISPMFFAGLVTAVFGVALLMSGKIDPSPEHFRGDFLAIATALFYGLYLLTVNKLRARYNAGDILFWGGFSSLAVLLAAAVFSENAFFPQTAFAVLVLGCLALFSQIGGQGLIAVSFGRLPVSFASVAVLMQPVIAAFYAYLIFSETLSALEAAGAGVVLAGIYICKKGSAGKKDAIEETIKTKLRLICRDAGLGSCRRALKSAEHSALSGVLAEDLHASVAKNPAAMSISTMAESAGFYAVCAYRLAAAIVAKGGDKNRSAAFRIQQKTLALFGIDIDPRARIGKRFVMDHAHGIVIGETCHIGDDLYLLGGVVLGERGIAGNPNGKRHPTVGDRAEIGMNARILGPVTIGNDVFISPHAIVTENVPDNSRVIIVNQSQVLKPAKG